MYTWHTVQRPDLGPKRGAVWHGGELGERDREKRVKSIARKFMTKWICDETFNFFLASAFSCRVFTPYVTVRVFVVATRNGTAEEAEESKCLYSTETEEWTKENLMSHHCQPEQDSVGVKLRPFPIERTFRCVVVRVFEHTLFFPFFSLVPRHTMATFIVVPSSYSSFVFLMFFFFHSRGEKKVCILSLGWWHISYEDEDSLEEYLEFTITTSFFCCLKEEEEEEKREIIAEHLHWFLFRLPRRSFFFLPLSCCVVCCFSFSFCCNIKKKRFL